MLNPFRRKGPSPGAPAREVAPGIEMKEGNDDSDWALWEDSVQSFESSILPLDPFDGVGRHDA